MSEETSKHDEGGAAPARARARRKAQHDDHGHGHDDHGHGHGHDEPVEVEQDDPSWWVPHTVIGLLVLVGMLGMFGVFNSTLGSVIPKAMTDTHGHDHGGEGEKPKKPEAAKPPETKPAAAEAKPAAPVAEQGDLFGAKHLLVMHKDSRRAPPTVTRTKEEAKKRADEAAKRAKTGKEKFEDLVGEFSDEPGAAQRGGDLGSFRKGAMVPAFQAGLEKVKVGEVSDVVETEFGYHVILRTK
jgi:hypothetical protein